MRTRNTETTMAFAPTDRHLLRAKDLVDARYFEPLGVQDMARAAGLSRAHFSREFRRAFGEPPHAYLLTRRLERAAALLRGTDRPCGDRHLLLDWASQPRVVHDQLHAHLRHVAQRVPRRVPTRLAAGPDPGLHPARIRAPATPQVSRRQRGAAALALAPLFPPSNQEELMIKIASAEQAALEG